MPELMKIKISSKGGKDNSDNLDDRKYAELFIENNIKFLSQLEVRTEANEEDYEYVGAYIKELIDEYDYKAASTASASQRINAVLAAMRIPFISITNVSENAISKKKVYKKVEKLGQSYDISDPDRVLIYRYGNEFKPKMYATIEAGRTNKKDEPVIHEEPTIGVRLRINKWLEEIASEEIDKKILEKVGFDTSLLKD